MDTLHARTRVGLVKTQDLKRNRLGVLDRACSYPDTPVSQPEPDSSTVTMADVDTSTSSSDKSALLRLRQPIYFVRDDDHDVNMPVLYNNSFFKQNNR